jgi:hypothetical protein
MRTMGTPPAGVGEDAAEARDEATDLMYSMTGRYDTGGRHARSGLVTAVAVQPHR